MVTVASGVPELLPGTSSINYWARWYLQHQHGQKRLDSARPPRLPKSGAQSAFDEAVRCLNHWPRNNNACGRHPSALVVSPTHLCQSSTRSPAQCWNGTCLSQLQRLAGSGQGANRVSFIVRWASHCVLLWPLPTRRKETVLLILKDTIMLDQDANLVFILLLVRL